MPGSTCSTASTRNGEPDRDLFAGQAVGGGLRVAADDSWSDIFSRVLVEKVEPQLGLGRPVFLTDYPACEAALARISPRDSRIAERFELYACGVELANAFGELGDPAEQRRRFEEDMKIKARIYGEAYPLDEDFLAALAEMPEASGAALGFDRLVMLACGAERIEDVQWTPVFDPRERAMSAGEMLLEKARVELSHVFGFPSFRPGQEEILRAVLGGEDVLAVMPTGSGKSLCFQLPPLAREGLTLVVSPLIALDARPGRPAAGTRRLCGGAEFGVRSDRTSANLQRARKSLAASALCRARAADARRHAGNAEPAPDRPVRDRRGPLRLAMGPRFPPRVPALARSRADAWGVRRRSR